MHKKDAKVRRFLRTVLDADASFEVLSKDKIELDKNQQTAYYVRISYAGQEEYCTVVLLQYSVMYIQNGLIFNAKKGEMSRYYVNSTDKEIKRKNFIRDDENGTLYKSFLGKYRLQQYV
ncbi:MAG: hypothetical protein ACLTEH_01575 [Clostridia bacterium]